MKTLRRLSTAVVLTLLISLTAFAGETLTPPCAPPEPGEVLTPPCSSAQVSNDDPISQAVSSSPGYAESDLLVSDFSIELLRQALSLF